jgi:hypothetical protein
LEVFDMTTAPHTPGNTWHKNVFFGLHFDLHASETDTELGAQTTEAHIRAELKKVRPDWVMYDCKGVPGYAGYPTRAGLPSPGIVNDALKIWRKVTRDLGIPLSVHYCGLWDDAQWQRHPEWAALRPDGTRYGGSEFDGLHSHPLSVTGPYCRQVLIPQLLEVIDDYDVDGVWVDADAWVAVPDWGELTRRLFVEEMCSGQKPGVSETPGFADSDVPRKPGDPYWQEYLAFNRRLYAKYLTEYANALHERKVGFAVCSNWAYSARMPDEIDTPVDYLSGDYTWTFAAETVALEAKVFDGRGLPWDLMGWGFTTAGPMTTAQWTTRSAAELEMEGALVCANGGAFWIYDTPVRNGRLVDWHMDTFAEVGRFLRARQPAFQGTESASHVALLHSQCSFYANADAAGPVPLHPGGAPLRAINGALQLLLQNHYHADVLNEDALLRRMDDYPVIVVAEQTCLPQALKDGLVAWVRRGGRLLLTGSLLAQDYGGVLGVTATGAPAHEDAYVPADGGAVPIFGEWQRVRLSGAKSLVPLLRNQEPRRGQTGYPAATLRKVGKGAIAAIFGPVATNYADHCYPRIRSFVGHVLQALAGPMPVELDAPPWVIMTVRQRPGQLIVHLVNTASVNPLTPNAPLIEGLSTVGPLTLRAWCARRPRAVSLAPVQGECGWKWLDGLLTIKLGSLHIHTAVVVDLR